MSGGVRIAAMMNARTMKYERKLFSFSIETIPSRASTTTAIGTSNAAPNAMNIIITKLRYASMSGIAETLFGAKLWMNVKTLPKTKK